MSIDAAQFRQIMGRFATGVTVITTAVDDRLHGMTANAVTSVSLDPLMLLVCVDKGTYAHGELLAAGRFAVNILGADQEELSQRFATKGAPEHGSLRGAAFRLSGHGLPVLEGCLAYLECTIASQCEGGDHTIFIGSVVGGEVLREDEPLVFYRGQYRRLA